MSKSTDIQQVGKNFNVYNGESPRPVGRHKTHMGAKLQEQAIKDGNDIKPAEGVAIEKISEAFETGFLKAAMSIGVDLSTALQLAKRANELQLQNQNYMPLNDRRELTPTENTDVSQAEARLKPTIFTSDADPITAKMYSPASSGVLNGLIGGAAGAGMGGLLGSMVSPNVGGPTGAAIGGLTGAGFGGLTGYFGQKARNNSLEEAMRRNKPGATMRDYYADPVYQHNADRSAQEDNYRMLAAAAFARNNMI